MKKLKKLEKSIGIWAISELFFSILVNGSSNYLLSYIQTNDMINLPLWIYGTTPD